ncbi:MAG: patatin-like phospholipase family protein [Pseudomonadota bacterium]
MTKPTSQTKKVNLALQGGGAHGAFTWGVLDRLLQEENLEIASISGTSAGALNGAALKSGYLHADRQGARDCLDWLWDKIGATQHDAMGGWMLGLTPGSVSRMIESSPLYMAVDAVSRAASPYAYGPLYSHPLRAIVDEFNFDRVCALDGPELFVSATNVRSGKIKVFQRNEICTDAILASGCLPTLFQAIEIDDPKTGITEAYWDGGYMGNPALFPMFEEQFPDDILIVNINPLYRSEIPKKPQEIQNRINEISFNGSLLRELRAIDFVRRLIREGRIKPGTMKDVKIHMIADDALMTQLSVATKMLPTPYVLAELKSAGQRAADRFLGDHWNELNENATLDLETMFA